MTRPQKLPACALLVVWGSRLLTLAEKVVWYHDWVLDQGGADGCYASHDAMERRLGGSVKAGTISRIRQRLKRLTLHEPLRRRDARNLGWVSSLPRECVPRSHHDAPGLSAALDRYLERLAAWRERSNDDERDGPDELDARVQPRRTPVSGPGAAALGGRGEGVASASQSEAQLPSDFREKGERASARKARREDDELSRPMNAEELAKLEASLAKMRPEQAAMLRRIAGL